MHWEWLEYQLEVKTLLDGSRVIVIPIFEALQFEDALYAVCGLTKPLSFFLGRQATSNTSPNVVRFYRKLPSWLRCSYGRYWFRFLMVPMVQWPCGRVVFFSNACPKYRRWLCISKAILHSWFAGAPQDSSSYNRTSSCPRN